LRPPGREGLRQFACGPGHTLSVDDDTSPTRRLRAETFPQEYMVSILIRNPRHSAHRIRLFTHAQANDMGFARTH
jgi:hypothetical protein